MGRNRVKIGIIYIKLYLSIFIRKKFSYPPKVFLSETLYFELPKNLVICFKGILAPLSLDTTKSFHSCLLLLNLKQGILPQLLNLQISESHLNPPKTPCKHPKPSAAIQCHPPKGIYSHHHHSGLSAIGQDLPRASSNWSENIHIHVRTPTIFHKTNSSFRVKQRTAAKIQLLYFRRFCQY